jgi:2-polyprenyl-3-methyl-5-hydroxy-6-metoxy-1,4-benzoquinol methylase
MSSTIPPPQTEPQPRTGLVRRIARAFLWPVRRILDPRFGGMAAQIEAESNVTREHLAALGRDYSTEVLRAQEALRRQVLDQLEELRSLAVAEMDAAAETSTLVGEALDGLKGELEAVHGESGESSGTYFERLTADGVAALDSRAAAFLNHANAHAGFAAERNLWFNWPLTIAYGKGDVRLGDVNERIVENPYAMRALSELKPGARILDIGATENTLALSLASLGFSVTALDPRPYPLAHPNLTVAVGTAESCNADEPFDAVLLISTLEHIGSGEYGLEEDPGADAAALEHLATLVREGGLLVITTPYGTAGAGDGARVYERRSLDKLLAAWQVEDFTFVERRDATTWAASKNARGEGVALITARR